TSNNIWPRTGSPEPCAAHDTDRKMTDAKVRRTLQRWFMVWLPGCYCSTAKIDFAVGYMTLRQSGCAGSRIEYIRCSPDYPHRGSIQTTPQITAAACLPIAAVSVERL